MSLVEDPVIGNLTSSNQNYWTHLLNCDCDLGVDFINFWTSAGYCCDNFRLTIWYIFNILFFIIMMIATLKIIAERKKQSNDLNDFSDCTVSVNKTPFSMSIIYNIFRYRIIR